MSISADTSARLLGRSFGVVLAFGIATVVLGVILMVFTEESVKFFAVICGIYLILSGIFMLVASFSDNMETTGMRVLSAVGGVLSILLGLIALRGLAEAVAILALLIGIGWIIRGVADLIEGVAHPGIPARGWVIFIGILSLLAGIVVLTWPAITLGALVWVTGLWLVVLGVIEIIGSFQLRGMAREIAS